MIYLGADHGGFPLKEKVKGWLEEWKQPYEDIGAKKLDPEDDYPQFAFAVAEKVAAAPEHLGILFCRSSGGVIIAANKVPFIRAVACWDELSARHSREHNHANVIALAGDWTSDEVAKKIVETFLHTKGSEEARHLRRIEQIQQYETMFTFGGGCCGGGCGGGCGH